MGHAESLSAPRELSGRQEPPERLRRKSASLRGRCAVGFLIGLSLAGYSAMFYIGQVFLVN